MGFKRKYILSLSSHRKGLLTPISGTSETLSHTAVEDNHLQWPLDSTAVTKYVDNGILLYTPQVANESFYIQWFSMEVKLNALLGQFFIIL